MRSKTKVFVRVSLGADCTLQEQSVGSASAEHSPHSHRQTLRLPNTHSLHPTIKPIFV